MFKREGETPQSLSEQLHQFSKELIQAGFFDVEAYKLAGLAIRNAKRNALDRPEELNGFRAFVAQSFFSSSYETAKGLFEGEAFSNPFLINNLNFLLTEDTSKTIRLTVTPQEGESICAPIGGTPKTLLREQFVFPKEQRRGSESTDITNLYYLIQGLNEKKQPQKTFFTLRLNDIKYHDKAPLILFRLQSYLSAMTIALASSK